MVRGRDRYIFQHLVQRASTSVAVAKDEQCGIAGFQVL